MSRPAIAVALIAVAVVVPGTRAESGIVDRVIATVNEDAITLSDFYTTVPIFLHLNQIPPAAYASQEGRRMVATRVMQELVNRILLEQEAARHELQVERQAVDGFIARMARQSGSTVQELRNNLQLVGIRYEDFYEYIRLELTKLRVINVMVTSDVSVSDAEVNEVFMERYPDGVVDIHVDVSQIMLTVPRNATEVEEAEIRAQAEDIRAQLLNGADFEALAREHSQDPSQRRGGQMGSFTRGQLPPEFEEIAFNLLPGQLSEVTRTRFGYHIVRLNDRRDEASVDIDAAREEIYRELQQEKTERELERFMAGLHDENIVQVLFDPTELY